MSTALKPPFSLESAREKVQRAEDLWNTRNPQRIALAYSENSQWRNRSEFVQGREEIASLLARKWTRELGYKLKKELFAYAGNRIAVLESNGGRATWDGLLENGSPAPYGVYLAFATDRDGKEGAVLKFAVIR